METNMETILTNLREYRTRIDAAIAALGETGPVPAGPMRAVANDSGGRPRRHLTEEHKAKIRAALKKRAAETRKAHKAAKLVA